MVGCAGSPVCIVHADMTLTRSKVKATRRWPSAPSGAFIIVAGILDIWMTQYNYMNLVGSFRFLPPLVVEYWHGYLSGARSKWFAYGPADATATPSSLAPIKSRILPFGCRLTQVVLGKRPLNRCCSSSCCSGRQHFGISGKEFFLGGGREGPDALPDTQRTVLELWRWHKALTPTSGLASSFHPDAC